MSAHILQPVVYQKIARKDCTKPPICAEGELKEDGSIRKIGNSDFSTL